jgi:outer membrane protein insertion porin family
MSAIAPRLDGSLRRVRMAKASASRALAAWMLAACAALLAAVPPVFAQPESGRRIDVVQITGNSRVDSQAIRIHVKMRPGDRLDMNKVDADVRAIFAMGFFENVTAELDEEGGQSVLTFRVQERPLIADVDIEGNDELDEDELETALAIRPRTIYDPEKVRRGIEAAKRLYEEKGYLDVDIEARTEARDSGEVRLVYEVKQGAEISVGEIIFEGNENFSDRELRGVMTTKEAWFLSFLLGSGTLNREELKTDVERLTAFYYDHGYVNVKIDTPIVEREGDELQVSVRIEEGDPFDFGGIGFAGDYQAPGVEDASLKEQVGAKEGERFRASLLREDVDKLSDFYGDLGYAFANVEPETLIHPEDKRVDVNYRVSKGNPVTIGEIEITGNTKTRDKVVRREMRIHEQEQFSATKLRRSRDALRRLGFFSEVNVTTRKASSPDEINVLVDLKEGSTGAFSAGAGFSSGDEFLFNVRVSENNLFGYGIRVVANADIGTIRNNIFLSATDPYLLDTQLLGSVTLFTADLEFNDFTRSSTGVSLRLLYPLEAIGLESIGPVSLEDTRVGFEYRLERARISDVAFDAPPSIFTESGTSTISSLSPNFLRNTLNHAFDPTDGSFQELSVEFAGVGGDTRFILFEARGRWFVPIYRIPGFGPLVYSSGGTIAYGKGEEGLSGREIPLVQRYFPGGINTVRGFETRTLGPRENTFDPQGNIVNNQAVGGTNELIVQNEIIFPIVQQLGLRGVAFFDLGNAWFQKDGIDIGDLRYSVGGGVRWLSPFGPLRLELGVPLNRKGDEDDQLFQFSFGAPL